MGAGAHHPEASVPRQPRDRRPPCAVAALLVLLAWSPGAAGQDPPFLAPNFNREAAAYETVKQLYVEIQWRATSDAARAYAEQCALAVRQVDDHVEIYGAPDRENLEGAWRTCLSVYQAVVKLTGG